MNSLSQRLKQLQQFTMLEPSHIRFRHWVKLYHSRFPYQERASVSSIAKSIRKKESMLQGLITRQGHWGAFTLCEFYSESTLLAYLATAEDYEGQGLASQVVDNALKQYLSPAEPYFWLEANPKLWKFYKKLGFKLLDIDYRIPEFYSSGTEKMGLLVKTNFTLNSISVDVVKAFVSELLLSGYLLTKEDLRYQKQMAIIQNYPQSTIALI